jgi:hypothetical protein
MLSRTYQVSRLGALDIDCTYMRAGWAGTALCSTTRNASLHKIHFHIPLILTCSLLLVLCMVMVDVSCSFLASCVLIYGAGSIRKSDMARWTKATISGIG